ncbi:MAG: TRAP transporter permease [Thermodesulfobacteriota bacterium]
MKPSARQAETSRSFELQKYTGYIAFFVAIVFSLFHLANGYRILMDEFSLRAVHLSMVLLLAFLLLPVSKRKKRTNAQVAIDLALGLLAGASSFYAYTQYETLVNRIGLPVEGLDLFCGLALIALLIEATRRKVGLALPIICVAFIAYAYLGQYCPSTIRHQGYTTSQIVNHLYFTVDGIFGVPLGVSAKYIVLFILFGSFLQATKGGNFFIDLAFSIVGRTRGGPAKAGVLASGLFGTISGSAVANVMTTGQVTIPLMKKVGYRPVFAGAVEAVASSGGQLMPPIMGASAFIMAEILGVTYWKVVVAAIIPSILYYLALLIMVDLEAGKEGLRGMSKEELPSFQGTMKGGWIFLAPLILLVVMLARQYSAQKSVFWATVLLLVVSFFGKDTRINFKSFIRALEDGAKTSLEVALVCACVGIIIGTFMLTGLGLKFSGILIDLAGSSVLVLLILTMLCSLVLGMGMPTSAAYLTLAILVAPALISLGVAPMAAHLFVFYFGIISAITPPVALAAYAGASLAGADFNKTGWVAFRLGFVAFLIPYMVVFGPPLMMEGGLLTIVSSFITATLGTFFLAIGLQKFFLLKISKIESLLYIAAAIGLIDAGSLTDLFGFGVGGACLVFHLIKFKQRKGVGERVFEV